MTREDYERAVLDTLDALDELEQQKKAYLEGYREAKKQYQADLRRYRAKLRGEDRRLELEVPAAETAIADSAGH